MSTLAESFRYLTQADLAALQTRLRPVDYAAGEPVLRQGEERQALFVIVSGSIRVEKEMLGAGVPIAVLGEGEIFGEMSLVEPFPASATVVCETPARIGLIELPELEGLMAADAAFAGRFYHSLAALLSTRLRIASSEFLG